MNSIRSRLTGILIGITCLVWLFAVIWIHVSTQSRLEKCWMRASWKPPAWSIRF